MRRLLALTWKEFMQLKRDRLTLRMIIMVPMMQTLVFGYAINYDVKHLKTVVLDESRSYDSRELVARLTASQYFDVVGRVDSLRELQTALDSATAAGRPRHRPRVRHQPPPRPASRGVPGGQCVGHDHGDAGDVDREWHGHAAVAADAGAPGRLARHGPARRPAAAPLVQPRPATSTFIIPGLLAIILTFTLIQFTAGAIVRERELGTLEQLQVTPVTRTQLILGKLLPFIVIGYVQLTVTVLLMRFLFGIPIMGSVLLLYAVGFLFIAAVLGLGMLLSTIAQTQRQAQQLSMMFLLPFVFLSGYVFPIDGMPLIFQMLSRVIPARYFIEVVRGIVLRGAGLDDLWQPVAWLAFYTFAIIGLAVLRFRKTTA